MKQPQISKRENIFVLRNKLSANNVAQKIYGIKFDSEFVLEIIISVEVAFKVWLNHSKKKI